jgi:hypothetical protein
MTDFEYNLVLYGFPEVCYDLTIDKGRFVPINDMMRYKKKFGKALRFLYFERITELVGWTEYPNEYDIDESMHEGEWDQYNIYRFLFSDILKGVN